VSGIPTNVSCHGASDGSIAVTNSVGSTVVITDDLSADVTANNGAFGPGVYTITATLIGGVGSGVCTAPAVATVTITEPIAVTVSGLVTNVSCHGLGNGSISVTNSLGSNVVIKNMSNTD